MDAKPQLTRIAAALARAGLEAVLIGNAAAAVQGAPVTTLDFDFLFRATRPNLLKLKKLARLLNASILRPYYPVSNLFRVVDEQLGLQLDFMPRIHGIRSFEGLRARGSRVEFGAHSLIVAALEDIIKSKRAAGRARDKAALPVLEATLRETKKKI
ncbi:MAG TPA: hypothetical protein VGM29_05760 [Polyangiaceae bacterium]|jgi:hypothetical protein